MQENFFQKIESEIIEIDIGKENKEKGKVTSENKLENINEV